MNPFRTGKLVLYQVTYNLNWHDFEFPFFIILGILGGVFGALFIRVWSYIANIRRSTWISTYKVTEVFVISSGIGIISYLLLFTRSSTGLLTANLFRDCNETTPSFKILCTENYIVIKLLFVAILKTVFTLLTFGISVPAGIFLPSMCIGACVGRALGIIIQTLQVTYPSYTCQSSCTTPNAYAMIGAAAFLSGVTRMTISLAVIMFELTGSLSTVLPMMVTIVIAKFVGDAFENCGLYDKIIKFNNYPFLDKDKKYEGELSDLMSTRIIAICMNDNIGMIKDVLSTHEFKMFPIVDSHANMILLGFIYRSDLENEISDRDDDEYCIFFNDGIGEVDLTNWVDESPFTIHPETPIELVYELFRKMGIRFSMVVFNGRIVGIVTKKDLV